MQPAEQLQTQPPLKGLLDVPDEIQGLNGQIGEGTTRLTNMRTALNENAKTLQAHRSEIETLDAEEDKKLFALAEAEAEGKPGKAARDSLDSIRGRRMLLNKKITELDTNQEGRQKAIRKLTDELSDLEKTRDRLIKQWCHACYQAREKELKGAAQAAIYEWFQWMVGAGDLFPQMHMPQWVRVNVFTGMEQRVHADGNALKARLIGHAMGVNDE